MVVAVEAFSLVVVVVTSTLAVVDVAVDRVAVELLSIIKCN